MTGLIAAYIYLFCVTIKWLCENGYFNRKEPLTREQFCIFLNVRFENLCTSSNIVRITDIRVDD